MISTTVMPSAITSAMPSSLPQTLSHGTVGAAQPPEVTQRVDARATMESLNL